MKPIFAALAFFIPVTLAAQTSEVQLLLVRLDSLLQHKQEFIKEKNDRIRSLTAKLDSYNNSEPVAEFHVGMELFGEYQSFLYDSAFYYVGLAKKKALLTGQEPLIAFSNIKMGFVLLSSGLFKEALDTLKSIRYQTLPDTLKKEFYATTARAYFDLADYDKDPLFSEHYQKIGVQYLDTALRYVPENSNEYWSLESLRRMKVPDWPGAADAFKTWMEQYRLTNHQFAIAASSLGFVCNNLEQPDNAMKFLAMASIADVRASTRETVALRNLSNLLFRQGDTKKAYKYIVLALEDATLYNARHRKIEIASILPIIEGERLATVESQKTRLMNYAVATTMLSLLVILFLAIIYKQLAKLKKVKLALQETNENLSIINKHLAEANTIKEEYIGYFFNVNSEFIDKLDSFQKSIHRKVMSRQFDDLTTIMKNVDLKRERELLYVNFDKIFIKLFPGFVSEFNQLFRKEDWIVPKHDELLAPELRIFALMRLGIKDNDKIAKFLNYSVSTIYTYKTKIKAKSVYRDGFEEKIMEITSV
ncbi:MAG: DUF6377 domain-containing protein [Breznakibacter sp.]